MYKNKTYLIVLNNQVKGQFSEILLNICTKIQNSDIWKHNDKINLKLSDERDFLRVSKNANKKILNLYVNFVHMLWNESNLLCVCRSL